MPIVAAFFLNALKIDLGAFVVIVLGTSVCDRSTRAARWSVALTVLGALAAWSAVNIVLLLAALWSPRETA